MTNRINPFQKIYNELNSGNAVEKYNNLRKYPIVIDVELTNYCNLSCRMCATGSGDLKRQRGFMSDEIYNNFLSDIGDKNIALRFIGAGEPLLHPQFFDYISLAKSKGLLVHFNTNGHLFTSELMQKVIDLKVDSIKFSFQGTNAETYNEMRRGGGMISLSKK